MSAGGQLTSELCAHAALCIKLSLVLSRCPAAVYERAVCNHLGHPAVAVADGAAFVFPFSPLSVLAGSLSILDFLFW